jgi:hypothetical protein
MQFVALPRHLKEKHTTELQLEEFKAIVSTDWVQTQWHPIKQQSELKEKI